ncbi:MAG: protein kinase [Gemmatimonadaceae bacterium]|nr:protein kinase [Gemmatimonadaceae bacterium]
MTELRERVQQGLRETYVIESRIGAGGMGVVFRAHDIKHDRRVALKLVRPEFASAISTERFAHEIMTVARLTHPGILPVHDSGSVDGLLYYVMPFVEEGSLRDLLRRETQLPIEQAIAIAGDIGDAIAYAHAQGVIHRDLKPENILLESGRPVVADFGLALTLKGNAPQGVVEEAMGTAAYMAPEQGPDSPPADHRADVYSLGCILYEMLAGAPPITGPNVQAVLTRKMLGRVPMLRILRPTVPARLERAIVKALAPVPADRHPTMEAFVRAFRAPPSRRARMLTVSTAALVVLVAATSYAGSRQVDIDPDTVMVDEFENRTGDPQLSGIGVALADWTVQGLHGTRLTAVVPTPTALQASRFVRREATAGRTRNPLAMLAEETGAGIIVSGAYYLTGERLTFQTQLSLASAGFWERLLRKDVRVRLRTSLVPVRVHLDSTQSAIAEIRDRVMGALSLVHGEADFSAPKLNRAPPRYDAYDRFASAMTAYIANDHRRAAESFLTAYRLDTTFVVALLYAALARSNMQEFATEDSLLKVVARSPDRLTAYDRLWLEYRQSLLAQDRPNALRAVRALAAEAPRSKVTYNLAIEAWEDGHLEESLQAMKSLPPDIGPVRNFLPYWGALTYVHHELGNYGEALAVARRARTRHPGKWWPVGWELGAMAALGQVPPILTRAEEMADATRDEMGWSPAESLREAAEELRAHGHREEAATVWRAALRAYRSASEAAALPPGDQFGLVSTLYALGAYADAEQESRKLLEALPGDLRTIGLLGSIAARRGDSAVATLTLEQLAAIDLPYQFGQPAYQAALVASVLGKYDRALQLLRRSMAQGLSYGQWIHTEIDLEPLRGTRAYAALVRPIPLRERE